MKPKAALIAIVAYMAAEDRPRWRLSTSRAPKRPKIAPEAPTTGVSQPMSRPLLRPAKVGEPAADATDEVERGEPGSSEHRLEVLAEAPQGEHVEQDVEDRVRRVQERRGEEPPRLGPPERRHEGELRGDGRVDPLEQID